MTDQIEDSERDAGHLAGEAEFISAERLIFFSDAVVAIAITLLAFALPIPHIAAGASNATLWDAIWAKHIDFFAFLISFVVIGSHWRAHHRLFRYVVRLDSRIMTLNMVWLLLIIVIPFATKLLSGSGGFGVRFSLYAIIQVLTVLTFLLMSRHIKGSKLQRPGAPPPGPRDDDAVLLTVAAIFAISIPVAFVRQLAPWAFALWVASVPAAKVVRRHRTLARDTSRGTHDSEN
jgi:uncharacterized membrane protein